jgi:hypothetical protein
VHFLKEEKEERRKKNANRGSIARDRWALEKAKSDALKAAKA